MKSCCQTIADSDRSAADSACNVRHETARRGYSNRISQLIECGILVFIVSLTLLGNYVIHRQLMSDVLLS